MTSAFRTFAARGGVFVSRYFGGLNRGASFLGYARLLMAGELKVGGSVLLRLRSESRVAITGKVVALDVPWIEVNDGERVQRFRLDAIGETAVRVSDRAVFDVEAG